MFATLFFIALSIYILLITYGYVVSNMGRLKHAFEATLAFSLVLVFALSVVHLSAGNKAVKEGIKKVVTERVR